MQRHMNCTILYVSTCAQVAWATQHDACKLKLGAYSSALLLDWHLPDNTAYESHGIYILLPSLPPSLSPLLLHRGGALLALQNRLLNMTPEEVLSNLTSLMLTSRARGATKALSNGGAQAAALLAGVFETSHAGAIALMAAAAPTQLAEALRGSLSEYLVPEKLQAHSASDKAEQAACAEVISGLLAVGAPFVGAASGAPGAASGVPSSSWLLPLLGQAMCGTSLDMADAWALGLRYALRGLLDGLDPVARLARTSRTAPGVQEVLPALAAGMDREGLLSAVDTVLRLALSGGALPAADAASTGQQQQGSGSGEVGNPGSMGGSIGMGLHGATGIKRLKYVSAVVSELAALDPSMDLPLPVRGEESACFYDHHNMTSSI